MLKKRTDYTSAKHWHSLGRYVGAWRTAWVMSLLGLLIMGVRYAYLWFVAADQYNAQLSVVDSLAAQEPDNRRVVAANLLWLYDHGLAPEALHDPEFRVVVDAVQQTGSGGWTTIYPPTWGPFVHTWMPIWMLWALAAFSLMLGVVYCMDSKDRRHYLADLPWSKPWVWGFVLIAPVLWVPFVVSGVRMFQHPPQVHVPRERNKDKRKDFQSDPDGAKTTYKEMRLIGAATGQKLYREKVEADLAGLQETCADLAKELQEAQQEQLKLKAESARLHDVTAEPELPTDDLLEKEFERLQQLPGVHGVRSVNENTVALMVSATTEHEGHHYDLGTWDLQLDLCGSVEARELQTGVLPSWRGGSPVYRMSKRFCFGDHDKQIEAHLMRGHILEAAALAVQALHTVNTDHREAIPRAFRRIQEEGV